MQINKQAAGSEKRKRVKTKKKEHIIALSFLLSFLFHFISRLFISSYLIVLKTSDKCICRSFKKKHCLCEKNESLF